MAKMWSVDEKMNILQDTKILRSNAICDKYHISEMTLARWKREYKKFGVKGLSWGNGEQSNFRREKLEHGKKFEHMKKWELIEYLKKSKHLDLLSSDIPKKEKFQEIKKMNKHYGFAISSLCEVARVSTSGYYKWIKQGEPPVKKWNPSLLWTVNTYFYFFKGAYGYVMLTKLINKLTGSKYRKGVIRGYMKKLGLSCVTRKKRYKYNLESSVNNVAPNIFNRNFKASYFGEKLVTDITYLLCNNSTIYLSIVKDLYSGAIIDYQISDTLRFEFVERNIRNARVKIGLNVASTIHSDQGWHYTNDRYVKLCDELNLTRSMSRRGNSPDNGACETFFSSLKCEKVYLKAKSKWSVSDMWNSVDEYISFYNYVRPLGRLNDLAPMEFLETKNVALY